MSITTKRGISSLIATVLMILVTIAAVGIITQSVVPLVQENLKTTTQCEAVSLNVETQYGYSFYDSAKNVVSISVSRGPEEGEIIGFQLKLMNNNGTSKVIEIRENINSSYVDSNEMPGVNSQKVYLINTNTLNFSSIEKVTVSPIIKTGKTEKLCGGEVIGTEIPLGEADTNQCTWGCDDSNHCTTDSCQSGICYHAPIQYCT